MGAAFFRTGHATALFIGDVVRFIARVVRAIAPTTRAVVHGIGSDRVKKVSVVAVISGLVGTFALPAYALDPTTSTGLANATQHLTVSAQGEQHVDFDSFRALSPGELVVFPEYHGPSAADFLKNPPFPDFSLDKVFEVAKTYQGVPYRFGGASPAGFDCSGFVMFVYAQFGIALPHNAGAQGAMGKPISIKDARPGDLVIMAGHDGIYAGNGMILDAPQAGGVVSIRPLWTSAYYIVRIGI